jgi:hypothetical protein
VGEYCLATIQKLELEELSAEVALEKFLRALLDCVSRNPRLPTIMFHESAIAHTLKTLCHEKSTQ